jgi:hypothetical protein
MKNACTLLVVGSLFLAPGTGRSQDTDMITGPVIADAPIGVLDPTPATPAKCLTLQHRIQEWGKLRTISQTAAEPAVPEPAKPAPSVSPEPVPSPPPAQAIPPAALLSPPCMSGPGHRCCRDQLIDWLTYRPLSHQDFHIWTPSRGLCFWRDESWQGCHTCCNCLPKCAPCCAPPPYTFFLGSCCVHPSEAGGHGERFHIWTPSRGLLFWRDENGQGFHVWTPSRGLLFWRDNS